MSNKMAIKLDSTVKNKNKLWALKEWNVSDVFHKLFPKAVWAIAKYITKQGDNLFGYVDFNMCGFQYFKVISWRYSFTLEVPWKNVPYLRFFVPQLST